MSYRENPLEISVRELKTRLSEYLRRVANGEEVTVTSRGKPVAQLLPPRSRRRAVLTETEVIARFRGLLWARPGSGKKPALPKPLIRIGRGERTLAEIVSQQRG